MPSWEIVQLIQWSQQTNANVKRNPPKINRDFGNSPCSPRSPFKILQFLHLAGAARYDLGGRGLQRAAG
jgi:hypothetical protein